MLSAETTANIHSLGIWIFFLFGKPMYVSLFNIAIFDLFLCLLLIKHCHWSVISDFDVNFLFIDASSTGCDDIQAIK